VEALERRERSAAELVHALRAPISLKRCSPRFRDGRLVSFHGHGLADIASGRPVTEDTVFRIASITKTFTAVAAMQLWERGLIDLDAPAQDYLRAYRLAPAKAGWRPATVRHLMTHTAGIPETMSLRDVLRPDWGETVPVDQPLPSLAEFYRGALRLEAEPGTRFVYGNHSPATLGQVVEDVSGQPLDRYFKEQIFEPLGMDRSDLVRSDRIRSRLATGYALAAGGATVVPPREFIRRGRVDLLHSPGLAVTSRHSRRRGQRSTGGCSSRRRSPRCSSHYRDRSAVVAGGSLHAVDLAGARRRA